MTYQEVGSEWPERVRRENEKLYSEGWLCLPTQLVDVVIMGGNQAREHPGVEKMCKSLKLKYRFPKKT